MAKKPLRKKKGIPLPTPKPKPEKPPRGVESLRGNETRLLQDILPGRQYYSAWESPESFARHISSLKEKEAWQDAGWETGAHREEFTASANMKEALKLFDEGWKEGAKQIDRMRAKIKSMRPIQYKATKYAMAGSVPSVPRAVAGNILSMKAPESSASRKKPVITLLSDMSAHWGIDQKGISNRAAVVAALIDEIEAAGYSCEAMSAALSKGYMGNGGEKFKAVTSVTVKKSHQPVDTMRLAFGMGHASMFRRMIFADWGTDAACKHGLGHGLGSGAGKVDFTVLKEQNVYYVPSAEHQFKLFNDEEIAATKGVEYIVDALRRQGCPAFPKWTEKDEKNWIAKYGDGYGIRE